MTHPAIHFTHPETHFAIIETHFTHLAIYFTHLAEQILLAEQIYIAEQIHLAKNANIILPSQFMQSEAEVQLKKLANHHFPQTLIFQLTVKKQQ